MTYDAAENALSLRVVLMKTPGESPRVIVERELIKHVIMQLEELTAIKELAGPSMPMGVHHQQRMDALMGRL